MLDAPSLSIDQPKGGKNSLRFAQKIRDFH